MITLRAALLAEALGTGGIVFAGTGAIVVNASTGGSLTHLGVSWVFGAVVTAMIYTFGPISGAHFNPAVTLGFWLLGHFPANQVLSYFTAQLLGATVASFFVQACLGSEANLGATIPLDGNWIQSLAVELILTFMLMLVICGSALHPQASPGMAGIAIGSTVALEAAFGGPISGAGIKPSPFFWTSFGGWGLGVPWIYWVAPMLGVVLAVAVWRGLYPQGVKS